MNKEIKPSNMNSAILSEALYLRFKAHREYIYPTAEEIVMELKNESN